MVRPRVGMTWYRGGDRGLVGWFAGRAATEGRPYGLFGSYDGSPGVCVTWRPGVLVLVVPAWNVRVGLNLWWRALV